MNFSNLSPSHKQQFSMNCSNVALFSWDAVLQAQPAPVLVPHRVTSVTRKPALVWAPLSTGPCQDPVPVQASYRVTAFFEHPPAPMWVHLGADWHWFCLI